MVRDGLDGRALRPRRQPISRPSQRRRQLRAQGRAGALPSLRLLRLSVGASDPDLPRAREPRGCNLGFGGRPVDARERLDAGRGRGSGQRRALPPRGLHPRRPPLLGSGDGAGALGSRTGDHRQQRVRGDHPHVQQRLRRHCRWGRLLPRAAPRRDRHGQRPGLSHRQQRRLPGRLRDLTGGLRRGVRCAVRHPR